MAQTIGRDLDAEHALHRLRTCFLLVLNAVRLRRQARRDKIDKFKDLEIENVTEGITRQLYELIDSARKSDLARTLAHYRRPPDFAIPPEDLLELCQDDFRATSESLLKDYIEVREWFFEGPAFKEWQSGRLWYMYCYGEPRCGKSTFAAAVAKRLRDQYSDSPQCVVVSLFLGHGANKERYTISYAILGAILKQLIESRQERNHQPAGPPELNAEILKAMRYSPEHLQKCILNEMGKLSKVFLIVDGVDGQATGNGSFSLEEELVTLLNISAASPCALRLMLVQARTGTIWPNSTQKVFCDVLVDAETPCGNECNDLYWICERCGVEGFYVCSRCFARQEHCKDLSHTLKVNVELLSLLSGYLDERLSTMSMKTNIGRRISTAMSIVQHIKDVITSKANGTFVIAKLFFDSLIEQQSINEVLGILDRLPIYQRHYFNSLMFEIIAQVDEDRTLALTAIALVAASCNGNGRAMDFSELHATIRFLTKHPDLTFTKEHFLKCTKGLLNVSDVVETFHDDASTFLVDECGEILANHKVDLSCICTRALRDHLTECPSSEARHPLVVWEHFQKNALVHYSARNWGLNLRLTTSTMAVKESWIFLKREYEEFPLVRQMMFLASNNERSDDLWTAGSQLHLVAWFGLEATLQEMRSANEPFDPNIQSPIMSQTPLHLACVRKNTSIVSALLEIGADPSIEDSEGRTALWEAIDRGDLSTLKVLLHGTRDGEQLRRALNLRNRCFGYQTILMLAVQQEQHIYQNEMVRVLLEQSDLDLDMQDSGGRTALHIAASKGYCNDLQQAIDSVRKDSDGDFSLSLKDAHGRTPAMTALASEPHPDDELVNFLTFLERCCSSATFDVNAIDNNGRTLLHYAATYDHYQSVVEGLRKAKANINLRDSHGRTPLHVAAFNLESFEEQGVLHSLLDMGADLLARDDQDLTPYDLAAQQDVAWKDELLAKDRTIKETSPPIVWQDALENPKHFSETLASLPKELMRQSHPYGFTLLHLAVLSKDQAGVDYLLRSGHMDVNAQDQWYRTALHLAVDDVDVVQLLLDHKADVNRIEIRGRTALECAVTKGQCAAALALIKNGAHIVLPKREKQQLLNYAIRNDDLPAVEILRRGGASLFLYCRTGLLPSQTAKEDGANEEMISVLQECEEHDVATVARL